MKVWIEQCEQYGLGISWEGAASLAKATHCNGDTNLTEREINLAYGLKDKHQSILINHTIKKNSNILMYTFISFPAYHKHALNHDQFMM